MTDIYSGWTENRAIWNKGAIGVLTQVEDIENSLPFEILGFDSDNGSEFLNWHLIRYFTGEQRSQQIQFTRSRPYHSDDNAHVEQKIGLMLDKFLHYPGRLSVSASMMWCAFFLIMVGI